MRHQFLLTYKDDNQNDSDLATENTPEVNLHAHNLELSFDVKKEKVVEEVKTEEYKFVAATEENFPAHPNGKIAPLP
jgi:hypothetical protein